MDNTKAVNQGEALIAEFLDKNYSLDLAKKEALKRVETIEGGVLKVKGAEVTMKKTIDHLSDVKQVINNYTIQEAKEV